MRRAITVAVVAFALGLTITRAVRAQTASPKPQPYPDSCDLSRSPVLPYRDAMPEKLRCVYDEDGNGLDDEVEAEIAKCVVPILAFGAPESNLRTGGYAEPFTLFNEYRVQGSIEGDGAAYRIHVHFSFLFQSDGGFVQSSTCQDAHPGDSEQARFDVLVSRGPSGAWSALVDRASIDANSSSSGSDISSPTYVFYGHPFGGTRLQKTSHPVLYPSPGKHHMYHQPGAWVHEIKRDFLHTFSCDDHSFGDGDVVIPGSLIYRPALQSLTAPYGGLFHAPLFVPLGAPSPNDWHGTAPLLSSSSEVPQRWANACRLGALGITSEAMHLGEMGRAFQSYFPGEQITAPFFCGGLDCTGKASEADPVWKTLVAQPIDAIRDIDGDGVDEMAGSLSTGEILRAGDKCPSTPKLLNVDADGDHFDDACDPDPAFQQVYVAGGGCGFPEDGGIAGPCKQGNPYLPVSDILVDPLAFGTRPAPSDASMWLPWTRYADKTFVSASRGGFLDSDGDGLVDGEDRCPFTAAVAPYPGRNLDLDSHNQWAEDLNWPPHSHVGTTIINNRLGLFQRGDACDPYPVVETNWRPRTPGIFCPGGYTPVGSRLVTTDQVGIVGVSANDHDRAAFGDALPPRSATTTTFRCACVDARTGLPIASTGECFETQTSECRRNGAQLIANDARFVAGHGWRSLDYTACARDRFDFCLGGTQSLLPLKNNVYALDWNWLSERENDPGRAAIGLPRHFGVDAFTDQIDALGGSFIATQFEYVAWTRADLAVPPESPQGTLLPDPESIDPALRDLASVESVRLRSGFSTSNVDLTSPHCVAYTAGRRHVAPKHVQHTLPPLEAIAGSTPLPASGAIEVLGVGTGGVTEQVLLRPLAQEAYAIELADGASPWLASSQNGLMALLRGTPRGSLEGLIQPSLASDMLWIDRGNGDSAPRWARLSATSRVDDLLTYDVTATGLLRIPITDTTLLVQDARGVSAALVDVANGLVAGYDPARGDWIRSHADVRPLTNRRDAALVFTGSVLYVLGGREGATLNTDGWAIDVFGGVSESLAVNLPGRVGATATVSSDGGSLVYFGGRDASGNAHDDVWLMRFSPRAGTPLEGARLAFADTTAASASDPSAVILRARGDGSSLVAWNVSNDAVDKLDAFVRTPFGFQRADANGAPTAVDCNPINARAGELCAERGTEWWGDVGTKTCANACSAAKAALTSNVTLANDARGAALDGNQAWILRDASLERWLLDHSAASKITPRLLAQTSVTGDRLLAAHAGEVLLARGHEIAIARSDRSSEITVGVRTRVCGAARKGLSIGPSTWAIATTMGLVVAHGDEHGSLQVVGTWMLERGEGDELTRVVAIANDAHGLEACDAFENGFRRDIAEDDEHDGRAPIALVIPGRLLVARGESLFDLDVTDIKSPKVRSVIEIDDLRALRVDPIGLRAYGIAGEERPAVDLRGPKLAVVGTHSITDWVLREDDGPFSLRRHRRSAEVAEVVR